MASKYERITDLYLQTAGEVATQEGWPRFLTTACYNFRLSFDKQILLYAQRPDATAVLPIEGRQGWNQRFGRWVNRGSKGIAILDSDSNGQARIKYYFDIADTHPVFQSPFRAGACADRQHRQDGSRHELSG